MRLVRRKPLLSSAVQPHWNHPVARVAEHKVASANKDRPHPLRLGSAATLAISRVHWNTRPTARIRGRHPRVTVSQKSTTRPMPTTPSCWAPRVSRNCDRHDRPRSAGSSEAERYSSRPSHETRTAQRNVQHTSAAIILCEHIPATKNRFPDLAG